MRAFAGRQNTDFQHACEYGQPLKLVQWEQADAYAYAEVQWVHVSALSTHPTHRALCSITYSTDVHHRVRGGTWLQR